MQKHFAGTRICDGFEMVDDEDHDGDELDGFRIISAIDIGFHEEHTVGGFGRNVGGFGRKR